jgi:hypothetical protein
MRRATVVLVLCCSLLWGCSLLPLRVSAESSAPAIPDHAALPAVGGQPPAYEGPSEREINLILDTYTVRKNTALHALSRELFAKADAGALLDFDVWDADYEAKNAAKGGGAKASLLPVSITLESALGWLRSGASQTLIVSVEILERQTSRRSAVLVFREASDVDPWLCVLDVTVPSASLPMAALASHPSTITPAAEAFVNAVDDYFMNGQPVAGVTFDPRFAPYKAPLDALGPSMAQHFSVSQVCQPYAADQAWSIPVAKGETLKLTVPRCVLDVVVKDAGYYLTTTDGEAVLDGFPAGTRMRELHWRWVRPVAALASSSGETWYCGERLPVEAARYVPL